MSRTIRMAFSKETKRTYVFTETVEGSGCQTVYINKSFFGDKKPELIDLTVDVVPPDPQDLG